MKPPVCIRRHPGVHSWEKLVDMEKSLVTLGVAPCVNNGLLSILVGGLFLRRNRSLGLVEVLKDQFRQPFGALFPSLFGVGRDRSHLLERFRPYPLSFSGRFQGAVLSTEHKVQATCYNGRRDGVAKEASRYPSVVGCLGSPADWSAGRGGGHDAGSTSAGG